MNNKITIDENQYKALHKLWFVFGNNGKKHSHVNHRYIQNILEHGEDTEAFYNAKHTKEKISDECLGRVKEIIFKCPSCEGDIKYQHTHNTDWYGKLEYFDCFNCKDHLVIQKGNEINISA